MNLPGQHQNPKPSYSLSSTWHFEFATIWEFPKIRGYLSIFGVLTIRILLFRVLCKGPLFFKT